MTESERYKITSNEFADLLIEYNNDIKILQQIPDYSYNIINDKYAVLYIPVSRMTYNAVYKFGYSSIPKCYGLMFKANMDVTESYFVRNIPDATYTGQGVLVGIVDSGIDYTNPVFQYADKTSRIVSIWDQSIESDQAYPENFYYGTEYTREQINKALLSNDPLSVVPSTDTTGEGTAVAGVAAGYSHDVIRYSGIAPNSEYVIVKLKHAKPYLTDFFGVPENKVCFQENDIMFGIQYLIQMASQLNRPIAICLGLNSWQGSHNGEDLISKYVSDLGKKVGVGVAIAAGDEGYRRAHYYGEITPPNTANTVELNVGSDTKEFSMELWGYAPNILTVTIYAPTGELVYEVKENYIQQDTIVATYEDSIIYIDNRIQEPYSGDQLILFRFKNMKDGVWKFVVSGRDDLIKRFHLWLPIEQFISESTYFNNSNPYTTICIPANAPNVVTVTAYNSINKTLCQHASRGFTKSGDPKPDIAAPGVSIITPSFNNTYESYTGTSIAAAHVAGIAAKLLEWGVVDGNLKNMNSTKIRYILSHTANREEDVIYPNPDWGFGYIE